MKMTRRVVSADDGDGGDEGVDCAEKKIDMI
jgi:hypothetical protein